MDIRELILKKSNLIQVNNTDINNWIDRYIIFIFSIRESPNSIVHKHHILPRCLFPEFADFENNSWNMKILTLEEHREAHRLLSKIFPNNSNINLAYKMMISIDWRKHIKNCIRIHMDGLEKIIFPDELLYYESSGWKLGKRRGKKWVFKTKKYCKLVGPGYIHPKPWASNNSPRGYTWYNDGIDDYMLYTDDSRIPLLNIGRLHLGTKDTIWINDGTKDRLHSKQDDIPNGFKMGRLKVPSTKGSIWINNGAENKNIHPADLDNFIDLGYKQGMLKRKEYNSQNTEVYNNFIIEIRIGEFSEEKYPGFKRGQLEEHKILATRNRYENPHI